MIRTAVDRPLILDRSTVDVRTFLILQEILGSENTFGFYQPCLSHINALICIYHYAGKTVKLYVEHYLHLISHLDKIRKCLSSTQIKCTAKASLLTGLNITTRCSNCVIKALSGIVPLPKLAVFANIG